MTNALLAPVIVGAGLAGLATALSLAPRPVTLIARIAAGEGTSSVLAQGGIAVAAGASDHPDLHAEDTLKAGAGLCDEAAVRAITASGPRALEKLIAWGVPFDRDPMGGMKFSLEGAHSRRRVAHVGGDATGAGITRALAKLALATPSITLVQDAEVVRIEKRDGAVSAVIVRDAKGLRRIPTDQVILATGSAGSLWTHTTAPLGSWGQGLALAAHAGATFRDLEFMQFHPTAIDVGDDPMPLASEALRGEGARLIDEDGAFLLESDLVPRDIVARAIWDKLCTGHKVFLDARSITNFAQRFPTINAFCRKANINPNVQPIPVRPVAHYHMGGIATDMDGRTSVSGLWACGECAATGLHGANRLASNSLLEAAVMGMRVAEAMPESQGQDQGAPKGSLPENAFDETPEQKSRIRKIMEDHFGVLRDEAGMQKGIDLLRPLVRHSDRALVGLMIGQAALARQESRGAHRRLDFVEPVPECAHSRFWKMDFASQKLVEAKPVG